MEKALSSSQLEFWTPRVSKTGPDRTMLGVVWVPRDSLFASACRGKGKFRALWECSRCLFTLPVEEKLISGFPMRPKSGPLGVIWVPCDCLFPLPVEEKVIAGLPGNARDGLFHMPVKEKVLSRLAGWLVQMVLDASQLSSLATPPAVQGRSGQPRAPLVV